MPSRLIDCLRRAALLRDGGGLNDGQLLGLFVKHRDGDAFAALLKRLGPMVMGVCRRVLSNPHDAEDAFQAAFLVFARKADSVKARDSVAGWLYRVAYRTALEARARIARRRCKEQQLDDLPHPAIEPDDSQRELLALLDKELDRLPDKYRVPVVLCELEGMNRKEAARTLGLAEGLLSWRLAQAKKLLAKRLARYGLAISGVTLAGVLQPGVATACPRASTVKAVTAGAVPAQVLALTEGVMKAMLLSKLKLTMCVATVMVLAGAGATGLTYRATAQEARPRVETRVVTTDVRSPQVDDLEAIRLEMEALRKSLQATRERVKTLEGEVNALKGQRRSPQGTASGGGRMPSDTGDNPNSNQGGPPGQGIGRGRGMGSPPPGGVSNGFPSMPGMPQSSQPLGGMQLPGRKGGGVMDSTIRKRTSDPVSDAEAALKKLRENPGDEKATEALERALQRLKERDKQNQRGETPK